tara:strand:+ start:558 stop:806 length:249 start_codon:yes stop_codon:yes gene_type:complete
LYFTLSLWVPDILSLALTSTAKRCNFMDGSNFAGSSFDNEKLLLETQVVFKGLMEVTDPAFLICRQSNRSAFVRLQASLNPN